MISEADIKLSEEVARFYDDPLGFVYFAFPWSEPGSLEQYDGPDTWQQEVLNDIGALVRERGFDGLSAVAPIKLAVSSGHGIGKSTLSALIACWILSTRPDSQGTITANSFPQLSTKTWAALQRWLRMCITAHWFDIGVDKVRSKLRPDSWFVTAQTCREENSESFAGQHAANSTSWYLIDEASAIPDVIWEVAEGGMTDGEPMMFAWGNPTRSSGKFHRICFGSERNRWKVRVIDSRECKFTNKDLIAQWQDDHGEDSDFFRVRVRGLPPRASDAQFIGQDIVFAAQTRIPVAPIEDEPLVAGLDVARGGADNTVIRFRRGPDAAEIPPIKLPGEESRDSMKLVSLAADLFTRKFGAGNHKLAMLFVDETGVGGPIVDRLHQLGFEDRVIGVKFGNRAPDQKFDNMRAFIWGKMREWLARGVIDRDPVLEMDLTAPGYAHTKRDKLVLESKESIKKRGGASPDDGDALALTFAAPVVRAQILKPPTPVALAMPDGKQESLAWMS